jgi:hypothetical protein
MASPLFVHGYATLFDTFDDEGDVVGRCSFDAFLEEPAHLAIPMLEAHEGPEIVTCPP